jgi:hypothetical protein
MFIPDLAQQRPWYKRTLVNGSFDDRRRISTYLAIIQLGINTQHLKFQTRKKVHHTF